MTEKMHVEGVFILGTLNVVVEVDAGACTLVGYSKRELVGMHGSELILPDDQPATAASIDSMRRGKATFRTGHMRCKDGSVIGVEVRAQPLPDGRLALRVRRLPSP